MLPADTYVMRLATEHDADALRRLAALDSARPLTGRVAPSGIRLRAADSTLGAVSLTHLQRLEAESIHIMREVAAEAEHPVMLYSIGKDSSVMLHLAMK